MKVFVPIVVALMLAGCGNVESAGKRRSNFILECIKEAKRPPQGAVTFVVDADDVIDECREASRYL